MKKTVSAKQIAANRKNSLRSTGPRTEEGKEKVRLNALRHGLLSREVVLEKGEDRAEYDRLLEELIAEYQPVGMSEEMLVDRIASCYWRLGRVIRCETGVLRSQLNKARENEINRLVSLLDEGIEILNEDGTTEMLTKSLRGIRYLINRLENAQDELEQKGFLSKATHESGVLNIGMNEESLYGVYSLYYHIVRSCKAQPFGTTKNPEDLVVIDAARQQLLAAIKAEVEHLKGLLESTLQREELETERNIAISYLPRKEYAELILRYETTAERQLCRDIALLEQMQRQRRE